MSGAHFLESFILLPGIHFFFLQKLLGMKIKYCEKNEFVWNFNGVYMVTSLV